MQRISVLMPTYKQGHFLPRALSSLQAQSFSDWELILVDDGSPDDTRLFVEPYLADQRIQYLRIESNIGLGAALNYALDHSQAPFIAYLPSDDVYYSNHLASLLTTLDEHPEAILAFSGVRHHYNRIAQGGIPGYPLQLVQVLHRRSEEHWLERRELTTDDQGTWSRLIDLYRYSSGQIYSSPEMQ